MRHGKPDIEKNICLSAKNFGAWVEQYNLAGLNVNDLPSRDAVELAAASGFVVCSDLPRSLESARVLGRRRIDLSSSLFREFDMPSSTWRFPVLPLSVWLVFFRCLWMFGYSPSVEPFKTAQARARQCATQLVNLASIHGTVLFVGHGSLNWFLAKHLREMGWLSPENPSKKYWGYNLFSKHTQGS